MEIMFDIIGIDWGQKRFGLAFADSQTQLILPANYECLASKIWQILAMEITTRKSKIFVIGRTTNFAGQNTQITDKIDSFVQQLERTFPDIKTVTINERNSSKEAGGILSLATDKQQLNHLAAAKIVEYYFGIEKR